MSRRRKAETEIKYRKTDTDNRSEERNTDNEKHRQTDIHKDAQTYKQTEEDEYRLCYRLRAFVCVDAL